MGARSEALLADYVERYHLATGHELDPTKVV